MKEQEKKRELDMRKSCCTMMEECVHSRRCFMTGEYCSKQANIQKEKQELYSKGSIAAFVIMNFSDMSDVVYKWKIRKFVERLSQYLYIDEENKKLCCSYQDDETRPENLKPVREIRVRRSDSDPASNYVVCSRICQQMQIADLIIVDVSMENTNVFYEFGMAVALGKMILPICYSESFYKRVVPKGIQDDSVEEHHIGCYPWRKALFEYYGIRYKNPWKNASDNQDRQSVTRYLDFYKATRKEYGFSDIKYNRFPYHETIKAGEEKIGRQIYDKLKEEYNNATAEDNTLVVYTIEGFLNEEQAALCIVNFYYNITARMEQEECFCGERVGVLAQENYVPDEVKDSSEQKNLLYSVGEMIHIGMNEATFLALEEKVKADDFLTPVFSQEGGKRITSVQHDNILSFVKEHIRNRAMLIYPNDPVYVNRVKNKTNGDVLDNSKIRSNRRDAFCLYHVMLRTLRYTNEIVVDISNNCVQSLFWLGAAHGSDIYAITVLHEETEQEKKLVSRMGERKARNIFDVAGLWSAVFRSYDTEGFYRQLALAQVGIERHSRLLSSEKLLLERNTEKKPEKKLEEEQAEVVHILESYYRRRFWKPMHCYNQLRLYLRQMDQVSSEDQEPGVYLVKWDMDAISELSHYLSKRTVIGKYNFVSLRSEERDAESENLNFICVGEFVRPLGVPLVNYIDDQMEKQEAGFQSTIHKRIQVEYLESCNNTKRMYKGFACVEDMSQGYFTQQPQIKCLRCEKASENKEVVYRNLSEMETDSCVIEGDHEHIELAQLILWRDNPKGEQHTSYFRVGLIGASGPATYALAMLLVDEEQRKKCFEEKQEKQSYFLCELQSAIRKKFMKTFIETLKEKMNGMELKAQDGKPLIEEQKKCYMELVECAVSMYLSSTLYRYFLPLISETDIKRIGNGMHMLIVTMQAFRVSPFALDYPSKGDERYESSLLGEGVEDVAKMIPELLLHVLRRFQGVEALYWVKVRHGETEGKNGNCNKDTRIVKEISLLKTGEDPVVNCIYGKFHSEGGENK